MNITVELSPQQMKKCHELAEKRHQSARSTGAICTLELKAKEDPILQDYIGLIGEVAYCIAYGLDTNKVFEDKRETLEELQQGDVYHNGVFVDLKSSTWVNAKLIYPVQKKHRCKADYLCLVTVDLEASTATIRGFAKAEDFMRDENVGSLRGSRPLYIMEQRDLEECPAFITSKTKPKKFKHNLFDYYAF